MAPRSATQEERCRAFAVEHGYLVDEAHIYREVYSGVQLGSGPDSRACVRQYGRREVCVVVAYAIDRLARDPVHLGVILTEAEHAGARWRSSLSPWTRAPKANSSVTSAATRPRSSTRRSRSATIRGRSPARRWQTPARLQGPVRLRVG